MTEALPVKAGSDAGPAVVYSVEEGKRISFGPPSLLALPNGKLLAAFDQAGPDVKGLNGKKGHDAKRNRWMQGLVLSSGDGGVSWQRVATYPFRRASLFRDGGDVYLLGEASGGLCLMRSPDGGSSWSAPMELTGDLDVWLSPARMESDGDCWIMACMAPAGGGELGITCWRAPRGASLMNRKAWSQGPVSPPLGVLFAGAMETACGVPWPRSTPAWRHPALVRLIASGHPWHEGKTLHLLAPAACGREHWALMARVDLAHLEVKPLSAGEHLPWAWLPLPGGHAKFDILADEPTRSHVLVGSRGSSGLAVGKDAERDGHSRRLGAWTSENLVDWRFCGPVLSGGEGPSGIRCDPSSAICGNDLVVVCRAGGPGSRNARETTQVLFTRLMEFRSRRG